MSGDEPDNRDAERAFGADVPSSGADAFGQGAYEPPVTPDAQLPASRPPDPDERHHGFAPPALPGGDPIAPAPPPPPPPPVTDPATTAGHTSTWPPQDPGIKLRSADGATASLVLGIISWVFCPIVCSIPAIILARKARAEIDASPTPLAGKDNASAGFWLGVSSLVVYGPFLIYLVISGAANSS